MSENSYFAAPSTTPQIIIAKSIANSLSKVWYYIISLICTYFIISEVEYIFMFI